jgi:RNA polymerase sigma factor (sigma-70 family)
MTGDFPATRWSLIGAPDATGTLLALYAEPIARYLAMKLPEAVRDRRIDDVVQETLTWLAEHPEVLARAKPGAGSRFRWYVMTVAFNQARNALRRLRPEAGAEAPEAEIPPEEGTAMDRAWAASVITDAWRDLAGWTDAATCAATRLHLSEGLGVREIAQRLDLSLGACHRRIASGRGLLRKAIVDRLQAAGETAGDEQAACDALLGLLA